MSRFADPTATARFSLGACECPGAPHEEDWIDFRTELGAADLLRFAALSGVESVGFLLAGWNLLDNDGSPAEATPANVARLFTDAFDRLNDWLSENVRVAALPNASGARSLTGSRASASLTRATTRRR